MLKLMKDKTVSESASKDRREEERNRNKTQHKFDWNKCMWVSAHTHTIEMPSKLALQCDTHVNIGDLKFSMAIQIEFCESVDHNESY